MSTPVNDDDARDLALAIAGDQDAFARIYDRHAAVVLSLCRHKSTSIGSQSHAEDACQETFARAFRLLPRINGQIAGAGGLRPWLYAIARRVCLEDRRSIRRRRFHEGRAMTHTSVPMLERADCATHEAERSAVQREQLERMGDAIEHLNDAERLALHLYYLDRDPVSAARETLHVSRSGYYKLITRARDKIAIALGEPRDAAR